MELFNSFQDAFWDKRFWLAPNVTWDDLRNTEDSDMYMAQPRDLWVVIPCACVIFAARSIFERFVATPVGEYFNIPAKKVYAPKNDILEKAYKQNANPDYKDVEALSKQTDRTEKHIQRWFRRRRNQDRPTTMTKYTETAWRCFFYLGIFLYGLATVTQKSWFWDVKDCWRNHPKQHVPADVYWYYMIELGFYTTLLFSQFADVQRKDFWEQFIHHIATISLMSFSWSVNYVRVGTLILCLHDAVDYLLEGAKLARYMNMRTLCDTLFGVFTFMWAATRLVVYPYVILWTTGVDSYAIAGNSFSIGLFNVLLWVLQILHVFWFIMIMTVLIKALAQGKVDKDVRSASEESCDDLTEDSKSSSSTSITDKTKASTNGSSHTPLKKD